MIDAASYGRALFQLAEENGWGGGGVGGGA